jgi:hypothetical protein
VAKNCHIGEPNMSKSKRLSSPKQKIHPKFKIYKKKIDRIYNLEKKYWDEIRKRRSYLNETAPEINDNLEPFFPSNISSRIYACIDGVVLLRSAISGQISEFEIFYINEKLEEFFDHLPIPTQSGDINLSQFIRVGSGTELRIINSVFNNAIIERLWIDSFLYGDEEKLAKIEEALTDFKFYLNGLTIDASIKPLENKNKDAENIFQKLEDLIKQFEEALEKATKEEDIQKFFKENPIFIKQHSNIIPKQKLGEEWITDFVLVNMLDQGPKYTLVEIEMPSMKILTEGKEFTSEFRHAQKQILDWDIWLQSNQDYIQRKLSGFESPNYLIIGGRSKNLGDDEKKYIRAWNRSQKNTTFLTYDDVLEQTKELLISLKRHIINQ